MSKEPRTEDEAALIVATATNERRQAVFAAIYERRASAPEIAAETGFPVAAVREQLRRLREDGLIELVAEEPRRGVSERFYAATTDLWIREDGYEQLDEVQKTNTAAHTIKAVVRDAVAAIAARTMTNRPDMCVSRVPLLVDQQGWEELAQLHEQTLRRVDELRRESGERLRAGGAEPAAEPIRAESVLIWFERPPLEP